VTLERIKMATVRHNAANERTKRAYFAYLKEARRYSEASLSGAAKALVRFEEYTRFKEFRAFHIEQAIGFKRRLAEEQNIRTGERLSKATLYSTLQALRNFFIWLAGQPGFKSRISYADADYFNLSDNETRIAKAQREQTSPTLEQVHHVLETMPHSTDIERRNRAVIAFALLTGARDGALASIKLKHVDLAQGRIIQDAREVRTKFSKTFTTWFFPVGGEALDIFTQWIGDLSALLWGPGDPLFPATRIVIGTDRHFAASGLARRGWSGAAPVRAIFREAFTRAGLPYFNPHSFRKTLAQLGERLCNTPEEFKAWSQNLGHDGVLTTFSSYGTVAPSRQAAIIRALGAPAGGSPNLAELFSRIVQAEATKHFTAAPSRSADRVS
jgi:integrase